MTDASSSKQRSAIPEDVKRRLRQESGFGCCECGHPFIEFHHIIPWAEEQHNRPEDMMVLCPNHHHELAAALTAEEQRKLKLRPRNVMEGLAHGKIYVKSKDLRVRLAGGIAFNTPRLLVVDGNPILEAKIDESGRVLVSAIIHDQDGNVCGTIVENEWVFSVPDVWDLETKTHRAIVRNAPRKVQFEIDTRGDEVVINGSWNFGSRKIVFGKKSVSVGDMQLFASVSLNCGSYLTVD